MVMVMGIAKVMMIITSNGRRDGGSGVCLHRRIAAKAQNRAKRPPISIKKAMENKMQVGLEFGGLLGRFLVDFGSKLGGKLRPSWHQNQKNEGPKTMSKKHQKIEPRRAATTHE